VFGILLHQRGDFVLHASAVRVGDRAMLFAGSSGAGKSTMAAALVKRGYPMITDDVCAISIKKGDVPRVLSDGRQLKLWANSVERLELAGAKGAAVRNKIQKFYVTPAATDDTPLPIGAVYLLREARTGGDTIQVTNFVDATLMLQRNCYRPRLVKALSQDAQYLQASAAVVAKAGVFMFQRTIDFRVMDDVVERLETHWRSLGFLEPLP
jgi:dephospho-CoA kinase